MTGFPRRTFNYYPPFSPSRIKMKLRTLVNLVSILIGVIVMGGCVTYDDPKDYQPSSSSTDTARLCLYRMVPRQSPGPWQHYTLDGSLNGDVTPDRYYCLNTHVGRHVVRVGVGEKNLEFTLEKDQEIFIRFDADPSFWGTYYPISVDRETARQELKSKGFDVDRWDTVL